MSGQRALVFANGDCFAADVDWVRPDPQKDLIVCADGGLRHCIAAGLEPHIIVGDMDSADKQHVQAIDRSKTRFFKHPVNKAASDLQLTLEMLAEHGVSRIVLLGASGGRSDHMLFNWLLPAKTDWPFSMQIVDQFVVAELVKPGLPCKLSLPADTTLSLLPVSMRVLGVSIEGVSYPLKDATLELGDTLGLSNVVQAGSGLAPGSGIDTRSASVGGRASATVSATAMNSGASDAASDVAGNVAAGEVKVEVRQGRLLVIVSRQA